MKDFDVAGEPTPAPLLVVRGAERRPSPPSDDPAGSAAGATEGSAAAEDDADRTAAETTGVRPLPDEPVSLAEGVARRPRESASAGFSSTELSGFPIPLDAPPTPAARSTTRTPAGPSPADTEEAAHEAVAPSAAGEAPAPTGSAAAPRGADPSSASATGDPGGSPDEADGQPAGGARVQPTAADDVGAPPWTHGMGEGARRPPVRPPAWGRRPVPRGGDLPSWATEARRAVREQHRRAAGEPLPADSPAPAPAPASIPAVGAPAAVTVEPPRRRWVTTAIPAARPVSVDLAGVAQGTVVPGGEAAVTPQRAKPGRPAGDTPVVPLSLTPTGAPDPFTAERFLKPRATPPADGWRRAVWRATGGLLHPGLSPRQQLDDTRHERIARRVTRCQTVAFASGKGGVGKTTGSMLCGTALAMHRGDRVLALDANPDAGSLGFRVRRETRATLTDLLRDIDRIERYSDVRAYTSQAASRLEVLASENDPAVSQAMDESHYRAALALLERHYNVLVADLGTGLLDAVTQHLLAATDQVVVVAAPSLDAGRVASFTLDFIERRHPEKVRDGIVVINSVRRDALVDVELLQAHFKKRVRQVLLVPYDRHLATGGQPEWDALQSRTRDAYLELAATVADGFGPR